MTYIPLPLKSLEIHKGTGDVLIVQVRFVLLEQPVAEVGVLGLGDGVLDVGLLQPVERDDDAVDLRQRVLEIPLGCCFGKLDFLLGTSGFCVSRGDFGRLGCNAGRLGGK